ncbi:glycoside hydrolase superfamily [Baffinella frigidus]|nr:glycoside hydrolase superfamily [Cryptophyta sp. CCMP2293]
MLVVRAGRDIPSRTCLTLACQHFHNLHWPHPPWRGANLGGLLLLEPGPAHPFFETTTRALFPDGGKGSVGGCEWALCEAIDQERASTIHFDAVESKVEIFARHRASHYGTETMHAIKAAGLNAVRIPFGYWIVSGPTEQDPYQGPDLAALDRVVNLAGEAGLQVLLDLHGAPGGENALRPCGRENARWAYHDWRMQESLAVLKTVAERFASSPHVTGLQVCNEPSPCIPPGRLCDFYEDAIRTIRQAGMGADKVAIVLPIHTSWRAREVLSPTLMVKLIVKS